MNKEIKMKTIVYLLIIALFTALAVGCTVVDAVLEDIEFVGGSGNLITQTYDESGFTEVVTGHGARVDITAGDDYSVTVEMDDNLEPYLEVTNTGGRLSIMLDSDKKTYLNTTLHIAITMPELKGLHLSGGSIGTISGFDSDQPLDVELSGGSRLRGNIESGNTTVDISGGSEIDLTGLAGNLNLNASGGSFAYLDGFAVQDVTLDASGGGVVNLYPSGVIRGQASGGATIHYDGEPTSVNVDTSGGARVTDN
jgi:hypothetical protein